MTRIILVRHGQTEWNRMERFRGHADVPLNEVGLAQAEATGSRIASEWNVNAVYSSPLSRAVRTAEAIAKRYKLNVQPHPDLIDISFGAWEGLTVEKVRESWPDALHAWYYQPAEATIPGGETLAKLRTRAMDAIHRLVAEHQGQTIVIVGHTVINRIILLGILGLGNERFWQLEQDPCAINVIEAKNDDFVLAALNDTCHLRSRSNDPGHQ